jgi:hypothetical protein
VECDPRSGNRLTDRGSVLGYAVVSVAASVCEVWRATHGLPMTHGLITDCGDCYVALVLVLVLVLALVLVLVLVSVPVLVLMNLVCVVVERDRVVV